MKEYGCGQLMADGGNCTSVEDVICLCDVCQTKLITEYEAAASELAALRKELEEAKAENERLRDLVSAYVKWVSFRALDSLK